MLLWNNIELRNKGIIVEKTPTISKGKKRINTYEIEGRNGVLMLDKGTYESFVVSVECHFDTTKTNINEIKEFLDGYGTLSFDGLTEYEAMIQNQIQFDKVQNFKKFVIQFLCNPISKDINYTEVQVTNNEFLLYIGDATANMNPIINIVGDGELSITFNNKTFYLYDLDPLLTYTLDCENKEIYNSNGINCSNQMQYDFPYLISGNNIIETMGTISSFEIKYKKSYL